MDGGGGGGRGGAGEGGNGPGYASGPGNSGLGDVPGCRDLGTQVPQGIDHHGPTDRWTKGRTDPLIEWQERI